MCKLSVNRIRGGIAISYMPRRELPTTCVTGRNPSSSPHGLREAISTIRAEYRICWSGAVSGVTSAPMALGCVQVCPAARRRSCAVSLVEGHVLIQLPTRNHSADHFVAITDVVSPRFRGHRRQRSKRVK
jgi:hypothetical protein